MSKPRAEVIRQLSDRALKAMNDESIEDLTAAEVLSAAFTLAKSIVIIVLEYSSGAEREHNAEEIRNATAGIYELVAPKSVN